MPESAQPDRRACSHTHIGARTQDRQLTILSTQHCASHAGGTKVGAKQGLMLLCSARTCFLSRARDDSNLQSPTHTHKGRLSSWDTLYLLLYAWCVAMSLTALLLPLSVVAAWAVPPAAMSSTDHMPVLTDHAKTFLSLMFASSKPLSETPVSEMRAAGLRASRFHGGGYVSLRRVEDIPIPTLDGSTSFTIRVYWPRLPEGEERLLVLLYAHGGGFVRGSIDTTDQVCRRIAAATDGVVVSVDYRLAPEHPYPAALDDVEAAYRWVLRQRGLDPSRIAVGGDSAGANLVAGLIVRLQGIEDVPADHRPKRQALVYPVLDFTLSLDSEKRFADGYGLTRDTLLWFREQYLRRERMNDTQLLETEELSPLKCHDLTIFPTTLMINAEADPLIDDGKLFVDKLNACGVDARLVVYPGAVHAFFTFWELFPESAAAVDEITRFLREGWERS